MTGKEQIETKNFFTFHAGKYNTRGHCYKLETKRSRLDLCWNFFSQRVVTPWNKLSESVVTAESVNAFKNNSTQLNVNLRTQVKHLIVRIYLSVVVHFNTATPNSTNFASKLLYYVFFNL